MNPIDEYSIKRFSLTFPFTKEDIEKAYKIFGFIYTRSFLIQVSELEIGLDTALNLVGQMQAHYDIPATWDEIDPLKQQAYFTATMNWLTATMKNTISLDAEEL